MVRQVIDEIRRRTVLQVLGIYIAGAWGMLQAVDFLADVVGFADFTRPLAVVLLALGLPFVLATAWIQRRGTDPGEDESADDPTITLPGVTGYARPAPGVLRRVFTWRNAVAGGVVAFALWGVVSAGWLVVNGRPSDPILDPGPLDREPGPRVAALEPEETPGDTNPVLETADSFGAEDATEDEPASAAPPPAPPPAPPAAPPAAPPDRTRSLYEQAYQAALSSRSASEAVQARSLASVEMEAGDSAMSEAAEDANAGRFGAARQSAERAATSYAGARTAAVQRWRDSLDALRRTAEAARDAADGRASGYQTGVAALGRAAAARAVQDYRGAESALLTADQAFRAAVPTEAAPGPEPEIPAADPLPTPRERVSGVLRRLERALESEDEAALRAVWTNLDSRQIESFRRFFDDRANIDVTMVPQWDTLAERGTRLEVVVAVTWEFDEDGNRVRQDTFELRYAIDLEAGGDVIIDS